MTYWGDIWVTLDSRSIEYATIREEVVGTLTLSGVLLMKISSTAAVQWASAYYSSTWGSWVPGDSLQYPVFPTSDGGYAVS